MKTLGIISFFILTICSCIFNTTSNKSGRIPISNSYNKIEGIINPQTQVLEEKVSIYKNFSGALKLKIEDLRSLTDKNLKIDFKFGHNSDVIKTVSGTVQKEGESYFLLVNLFDREFNDIALAYNLFDYSSYGSLKLNSPKLVQSNLHGKLYCRGLNVEDDPTISESSCEKSGQKCLYTYAKIADQGLYDEEEGKFLTPAVMQFTRDDGGFQDEKLKCLNDEVRTWSNGREVAIDTTVLIDGKSFAFKGPYKQVDQDNWKISGDALWGEFGLFGLQDIDGGKNPERGYYSKLFPISSKNKISNFSTYIGAEHPRNIRVPKSELDASGFTNFWMDGCNRRVSTRNRVTSEDISSCNVTALIEVYYLDQGEKVIVASTGDESSKTIRLQLVSDFSNNSGSDGKACISDSGCGANECCVGNQCVSADTGACAPTGGLGGQGDACTKDYECKSTCCKSGACALHDGITNFCNKGVGESCLTSIYCNFDDQLFSTRIIENSDGCTKKICNLDRLNCSVDSFTCVRNSVSGNEGSRDNPIDNYPNYTEGDCNGAILQSEVDANGWVCDDFEN